MPNGKKKAAEPKGQASASATKAYAAPSDTAATWAGLTCSAQLYAQEIATLRESFKDRAGPVWVKLQPVVNGDALRLCLDGKTLYINAIRGKDATWYHFKDAQGAIPAGSKQGLGESHYSKLEAKSITKARHINKIVANLNTNYVGNTSTDQIKADIRLLILFVSEACRFTSVCKAMTEYLTTSTVDLNSLDDTVKNWSTFTGSGSIDVVIKYQK